jgi:DNA-binding MarR family transcriptional regulator
MDCVSRPLTVEASLELLRTADVVVQGLAATLKPHGLSLNQYNVLRILRGAEPGGLPCGQIAERMLTRDPDMTRLLDRLEGRGLVSRCREKGDRRVVLTRITKPGLEVLAELDEPVRKKHEEQLGHLSDAKLRTLIELLESARRPL